MVAIGAVVVEVVRGSGFNLPRDLCKTMRLKGRVALWLGALQGK